MRKISFYKNISSYLFILGILVSFGSCKDDANDWGVDESADRVFSPVTFETQNVEAISVNLRFSSVPNAKTYVFEFSQDSLEFNSIVSTMEVAATNLVLDTTATSKAYIATQNGLTAETRYSARLKVISDNELPESKWVECTFKTTKEQILDAVSDITESSATITWLGGSDVTSLKLKEEPYVDGTSTEIKLAADNIAEGKVTISGLKENTNYTIEIYKDKLKRGSRTFTTEEAMPTEGVKHYLKASDNIVDYLSTVADDEVLLIIPAGTTYDISDSWSIPSHIKTLILWGRTETGKVAAAIKLKEMKIDNSVSNFKIRIHNLDMIGTDSTADYILNDNPSSARTISEFKIDKSTLSSFRAVIRGRGNLTINKIDIDNCIVSNIGGFGLINIDNSVNVSDIYISNSTMYTFIKADIIKSLSQINSLIIDHCTFYNTQDESKYVFTGNTLPTTLKISNSIFSGSKSVVVKGSNPKAIGTIVFGSYKTTEYVINSGNPLTGIEDYNKTSTDLFKDPVNADFTIIDLNIGGNEPGDPRWW